MVRLKKLRHVIYSFFLFVGVCFLYELVSHGIPEQRKIDAGQVSGWRPKRSDSKCSNEY